MIINCPDFKGEGVRDVLGRIVSVDGNLVYKSWYVDTNFGIVKTYDVDLGETGLESVDGVWSKTIHGEVELKPWGAEHVSGFTSYA